MTCTWCSNVAVEGGQAPPGVSGLKYLAGCETHKKKIQKLRYTPIPLAEIESIKRREEKQKKS